MPIMHKFACNICVDVCSCITRRYSRYRERHDRAIRLMIVGSSKSYGYVFKYVKRIVHGLSFEEVHVEGGANSE